MGELKMSGYYATKYDSARDEVVAILSDHAEGYGRQGFGDTDWIGGYCQPVALDDSCDLDFSDHTNYPAGDLAGELARTYGVTSDDVRGWHIVTHNSQGFVGVESFDTIEAFEVMVTCLEGQYAAWSDEDNDGEPFICAAIGHGYERL